MKVKDRAGLNGSGSFLAGKDHERRSAVVCYPDQLANDDTAVERRRFSVRRRPTDDKRTQEILSGSVFGLCWTVVETILSLHVPLPLIERD
jgi:hypothetical protein